VTKNELGGSHWELVSKPRLSVAETGQTATTGRGFVPQVDIPAAKRTFLALHNAIQQGLVRACHDLSEGGLAVAAAEMAFAGNCGLTIQLDAAAAIDLGPTNREVARLFSESASRFLAEVAPQHQAAFEATLSAELVPFGEIGDVTDSGRLQISADGSAPWLIDLPLSELKEAWQKPLRW
jgi:phosphoribosylformylglycinamidine synthase